jgi:hypothetical protein
VKEVSGWGKRPSIRGAWEQAADEKKRENNMAKQFLIID